VITPEELTLLSRALSRVTVVLGLEAEAERNDAAAHLIRLFETGQRDEEGLVHTALHVARMQGARTTLTPVT
jgi:hypothetical protein